MRTWLIAAVAAVALTIAACGPKPVVLPTSGAPHYPDFVEPRVPLAMNSTPASGAQARAWQFLQAGDLRNAEREATAALKATPEFYPASTTLAYLDLAKRDPRGAVAKFDRVLAREADYVPALVGRGQALTTLNRDEDAVQSFEAALRGDPSLTDVSRRLDVVRLRLAQRSITAARQAAKNEKFTEAIDGYRAAIARTPDSAFLYREVALIERDHGDGDAALEHFRRATVLEPTDAASFADLAAMLDARNEFDAALKAYDAALALEPDPALAAKRTALRLRADVARLPVEYRNIETAPQITRGELAAVIGFRLQTLLSGGRLRDVGVVTDIRGHWAERWILEVARAGIMEPFDNHTFQPRNLVRRVDLAQALTRLLTRVAAVAPDEARRWQNARGTFTDMTPGHVAYPAASTVVAAGVMMVDPNGGFGPARGVSGAEATDAVVRVLALSGAR